MKKAGEYLLTLIVVFTFVIPVIPIAGISIYNQYFKVVVTEEAETLAIPYQEVEEESYDHEIGYEEVTTFGEEGTLEITYEVKTRNDEVISKIETDRQVIEEPVDEVTTIGMAEPEYEYSWDRTGAICWDYSYSDAIGSGACSWHGGVMEWLYN